MACIFTTRRLTSMLPEVKLEVLSDPAKVSGIICQRMASIWPKAIPGGRYATLHWSVP